MKIEAGKRYKPLGKNDVLPKTYQYREKLRAQPCGEWKDGDSRDGGLMLTDMHLDTCEYRVEEYPEPEYEEKYGLTLLDANELRKDGWSIEPQTVKKGAFGFSIHGVSIGDMMSLQAEHFTYRARRPKPPEIKVGDISTFFGITKMLTTFEVVRIEKTVLYGENGHTFYRPECRIATPEEIKVYQSAMEGK
jgi:hypothetical protein